jgi:deazaflavin-dependent oxidoreductase (nitroreductase family)
VDFAQADVLNQAIRLLSLRHRARAAELLAPLGLHPGQEALLLELDRTGPMIQAQLSEALGCEPPSVTIMTQKLEATGYISRKTAPSDKRASIVELTDSGKALVVRVKELWHALARETVAGLPAQIVGELPYILGVLTTNVDSRRRDQTVSGTPQWIRDHVDQIARTGTTDGVTVNGRPTVLVTYRGAKTGKVRKAPLMRVEHDGRYAAVASKGGAPENPLWYASLLAQPDVELQDGAVSGGYRAREVFGDEKALWWRRAVDAYPAYAEYQENTNREIPVLVLEPR